MIALPLTRQYAVATVCRVLDLPRSSFYAFQSRQSRAAPAGDMQLKQVLETVAAQWPRYGYRRLTREMQRRGFRVGYTRIRRLMAEMGIVGRISPRRVRTDEQSAWVCTVA